ncbi:GntR family transcriptional regulator [Enterococcus timonensis]|uniref:GntR family transcriptional regulator n=1 Tax=Enterococcus timonensis TaxID=1852364 RepID=UPI0008D905DF|nr:GntR family transcriptional regulator [Enterococcus timonensis]
MSKYIDIANILRTRIKDGTYAKGALMPNQTDLVTEFSASRMTIKKAINILIMEGLLISKRGSGTRVLDHPFLNKDTSPVNEYYGLTRQMDARHAHLESQIIDFEIIMPDETIQQKLMIAENEPVYKIIRLRLLEGTPYILEHSFMPVKLVPDLKENNLHHSIYHHILEDLGLKFAGIYRILSAAKSDAFDQKYLDCAATDPVLEVEQVVYLESGAPIDYSRSRNRYDVRGYDMLDIRRGALD